MRIFIAFKLPLDMTKELQGIIDELRKRSKKGHFVDADRLHVTLEFLGELDENRLLKVNAILDELDFAPFEINLDQLGVFRRPKGNTWWLGIQPSAELTALQAELHRCLLEAGFHLEERVYHPHITLGRKVLLNDDSSPLPHYANLPTFPVRSIHVMLSHHLEGRLTYTVLHTVECRK